MDCRLEKKWQDVLDNLTSKCRKKDFKKLLLMNDCSKMVKHCLEDQEIQFGLTSWMEQYMNQFVVQKCTQKGKSFRIKGNDRFKVGDYINSLHFYTKSICHYPFSDDEYSLALANRSAALFYLQHYQECLLDIDLALQSNYPEHLRYKLLLRKGKIHLVNKNFKEAICALKEAEKSMPEGTKNSVRLDLEEALNAALSNCNLHSEEPTSNKNDPLPIPKNGESVELKYASAALSLKENAEKGRHIITNVDIKKGDVLFVEKPYAFVVLPGPSEIVCHHCCTPVRAQIPCKSCVSAVYCSQDCCNDAWKKYHRWECGGLELFYSLGIAHLGLRLMLISTTTPHDARYEQVMSLMSHVEDMELEDAYQYCLTATLLTLYLQKNSNFFEINNETVSEVGGKIMFHVCQLICNGHAITKVVPSSPFTSSVSIGGIIETCQEEWAATAIFPSASMMNHSCDPNIINSFSKEYLVVQAVRDIPCGEEVFNCYGPYYRRMNTGERKEVLKKQYFFDCPCSPCQQEGNKDFLAQFSALLCFKCNGPLLPVDLTQGTCLSCGSSQSTVKLMEQTALANKLYDEGFTKMENDQINEAIEIFERILSLLLKNLYKFNTQIRECRDNIAKCYATISNFNKSASYLIDNLKSIEEQFGEKSIEVANEIQKLTDLLIADLRVNKLDEKTCRERLKTAEYYVNKALEIYNIHYGSWNDSYKQMLTKDSFLKDFAKVC